MFGYIVRRLIAGLLVIIAVSMLVFAIFFYGPNDPALAYCPESRCTQQRLDNIRRDMGLDQPAPKQYLEYMSGYVKDRHIESGAISIDCQWPCMGVSFKYRVSVFDYLWERFPATLAVAVGGAICFLTIGLSSGIFAARRRGTVSDKAIVSTSLFINAIPYYLLALLAYLYLVQGLGLFPDTGYHSPITEGPAKFVAGLALPWIMLGIVYSTQYARFSRGSMIDSLNEDYVRTARAKGLSRTRGHPPARAARRHRPRGHDLRSRLRLPAGRHDLHREDLRHPGSRPRGVGCRSADRLADDLGNRNAERVLHRRRQHRCGHPLQRHRPQGASVMTQINEPASEQDAGRLSEPASGRHRGLDDGAGTGEPFLVVEDLTVRFPTADGLVQAVTGPELLASSRARPSASSASPARARASPASP